MARFRGSEPAEERPRRREGRPGGPEAADELKGIGDIADLLREIGRKRRRIGEDLIRRIDVRSQKES